jgi:hypothetical protein
MRQHATKAARGREGGRRQKDFSTREIAELTGWSQSTIVADLSEQKRSKSEQNRSPAANSTTARAASRMSWRMRGLVGG